MLGGMGLEWVERIPSEVVLDRRVFKVCPQILLL